MEKREPFFTSAMFIKLLKNAIVMIMDFVLFSLSNACICVFTENGHIVNTSYSSIYFSYLHFFTAGVLAVLINYLFGLYRTVWSFAGIDEYVRGIGASIAAEQSCFY